MNREQAFNNRERAFDRDYCAPRPRRVARVFLAAAVFALAVQAAAVASYARQEPNIARDLEEKKGGKDAVKGNGAPPKQPSPPAQQPQGRQRNRPRPQGAPWLEVTFRTDLPESEIFWSRGGSGGESLGKTDAGGTLEARLPRGRHSIIASRPGARILRQQVDVNPGSTNFRFNLALPAPPQKPQEKVAEVGPPDEGAGAKAEEEPKPSADEVVNRFLTNGEAEKLTADDWRRVRDESRAGLEAEPGDAKLEARALLAEGQLGLLDGDHANALIAFNKAARADGDYAPAHFALGNVYLATNQPAEALRAYKRATELNKELLPAYKGMGDALTKQGKKKEAANYYKRAEPGEAAPGGGGAANQPAPGDADLNAARILKNRRKWNEAVRAFEEIARTRPTAEVFIEIGDSYQGLEQPLSASKAYARAAESDPKSALAHFKYAEIMFKMREYVAAMEAYERALALDTTGANFNRSKAREKANEAAKKANEAAKKAGLKDK